MLLILSQQGFPIVVFLVIPGTFLNNVIISLLVKKHGRREPPTQNKGLIVHTRRRIIEIFNATKQVTIRALASALAINPN